MVESIAQCFVEIVQSHRADLPASFIQAKQNAANEFACDVKRLISVNQQVFDSSSQQQQQTLHNLEVGDTGSKIIKSDINTRGNKK